MAGDTRPPRKSTSSEHGETEAKAKDSNSAQSATQATQATQESSDVSSSHTAHPVHSDHGTQVMSMSKEDAAEATRTAEPADIAPDPDSTAKATEAEANAATTFESTFEPRRRCRPTPRCRSQVMRDAETGDTLSGKWKHGEQTVVTEENATEATPTTEPADLASDVDPMGDKIQAETAATSESEVTPEPTVQCETEVSESEAESDHKDTLAEASVRATDPN